MLTLMLMQEGDAIVWELLGHATRIWHVATQQLQGCEEPVLKAANTIFGYWSSRQAWLVGCQLHARNLWGIPPYVASTWRGSKPIEHISSRMAQTIVHSFLL